MSGDKDTGAAPPALLPERIVAPFVRLGGCISALLILAALAMTAYSVFMRYVLARPPVWIDDITGFALVALVMLGVAEAYRRGAHISIDLWTGRLGRSGRRIAGIWSDLSVLAFAAVLGTSAWEAVEFARMFGSYTSGAVEIESWIPQLPMLAGAALTGALALARLIARIVPGGAG